MARPSKYEERSEAIMQAFELCVAERGLDATTLTDIAERANLPRSLVRYFMGNRDEMVDRLVERIVSRSSATLAEGPGIEGEADVATLLDLYVESIFAVQPSSAVMGELWHLARSDAHVRERLREVYDYSVERLVRALAREATGPSNAARRRSAFAVVSLILGQLTLADFGVASPDSRAMRAMAGSIIDQLKRDMTADHT